jgi:hypothetical protein
MFDLQRLLEPPYLQKHAMPPTADPERPAVGSATVHSRRNNFGQWVVLDKNK